MGDVDLIRERRQSILELEKRLGEMPQLEQQLTHHFCRGLYGRELFMPKGSAVVGKIHKYECLAFILKGKVACYNVVDEEPEIIEGPCMFVSPSGTKRALYMLEDTIWVTVHPNEDNERDLGVLEERYIVKTFEELDGPEGPLLENNL